MGSYIISENTLIKILKYWAVYYLNVWNSALQM
jgi:hypothetical protein